MRTNSGHGLPKLFFDTSMYYISWPLNFFCEHLYKIVYWPFLTQYIEI